MNQDNLLTAPKTDAIFPSGMIGKPSVGGAFNCLDMKEIPLTQGKFALIDDEDYDFLNQFKWMAQKSNNNYYATRAIRIAKNKQKIVKMHRIIMNTPDNLEVDHKDHNGLNNQKSNLRNCLKVQNIYNCQKWGSSGYKGVFIKSFKLIAPKYRAIIQKDGRHIHLGYFNNPVDAALAYDKKAKELFGEFANPNFK
jgi:hypothetical protein